MQRRALVVDDEAATCELIQKVLYAAGVDALTLTTSGQAVGFLEEGKFDMVFFDLHMGSPDGMELSREMRRAGTNRTTPIILLTTTCGQAPCHRDSRPERASFCTNPSTRNAC